MLLCFPQGGKLGFPPWRPGKDGTEGSGAVHQGEDGGETSRTCRAGGALPGSRTGSRAGPSLRPAYSGWAGVSPNLRYSGSLPLCYFVEEMTETSKLLAAIGHCCLEASGHGATLVEKQQPHPGICEAITSSRRPFLMSVAGTPPSWVLVPGAGQQES